MKRIIALVTGGALVFALSACDKEEADKSPVRRTPPQTRIMEDDPRWDCETMGNRSCVRRASIAG